ncbi:MBOAT family O-acyltransferase [Mediterraneibacter glycyrrhizinilyticus]|uniref:MBOAT family O-acyltransferase n=1 Tax=Mediterraneibacter glycyrrhizinilyticus TaxID=342942 RepID=UPI0025A36C51|nr:MBOAT family O-acyltransferase [Mediterraneibacter glycyrrhizinilyticus]MDM8212007.1 MBOAT family O-acyltransferase [Mediterraneibacter glycyrrhizinilyticus]
MVFTSLIFMFVFSPICITGYYLLIWVQKKLETVRRFRLPDVFLTLASIGFYGWAGMNDLLGLCIFVVVVYLFGRWIQYAKDKKQNGGKRVILSISIVIFIAVLYYFKYYNFIAGILNEWFGITIAMRPVWTLLGVSFITFSAISYFVDIYRNDAKAGSFLDTALYLTFFPKVVSGPIVLWKDFSGNLSERSVSDEQFIYGINRLIIGAAKKVILADTLGALASNIQTQAAYGIDIPTAWGCVFIYFLQIYYDFSGYSDMALGLSAMFGFRFKENFHFPYISTSITEFWRRWHISLGSWFREYVYIPLGGNRKGFARTLINLSIVFFLTGIWHGSGWGYLCWGILHGVCMIIERCVRNNKVYLKIPRFIKWIVTMFIVMMGWQVFRLGDLSQCIEFGKIMLGVTKFDAINFTYQYYFTAKIIFLVIIGIIGAVFLSSDKIKMFYHKFAVRKWGFVIQEVLLLILFVLCILFIVNSTYSPFIYFQY